MAEQAHPPRRLQTTKQEVLAAYIFLAYDHDDATAVSKVRDSLRRAGIQVWWDQSIREGDVVDAVEQAIGQSACVVPIWTSNSRKSTWVRDEVRVAQELGRPLCAARLERVSPPVGYGQSKLYDLYPWNGQSTRHLREFTQALRAIVSDWASQSEPVLTLSSKKTLHFPCFVHSVSSHETFLRPEIAARALQLVNTDAALVSAYDLARDTTRQLSRNAARLAQSKAILFLDSGNYEASRKADTRWTESRFQKTLPKVRADLVFSFDRVHAPANQRVLVRETVAAWARLSGSADATAIPVLHLPRSRAGTTRTDSAPSLAADIVQRTGARLIAIPERELGDGVIARARTVWELRKALNSLPGPRRFIHLLGTGNPLSFAIFAAVGADSFDGLEWCRTVADEETMFLFHTHQFDFFQYQAARSPDPIIRASAQDNAVSYTFRIALHNLGVLTHWGRLVRTAAGDRTLDRLLAHMLPKGAFEQLASSVPEVFSRI
jgi:TIR domain